MNIITSIACLVQTSSILQTRSKMAKLLGLLVVLLLTKSAAANSDSLDVTRYFSLAANSTCGDTPPIGSGDTFGCLFGERNATYALDGDLSTWWQSENGQSHVEMMFSLQNTGLSLAVVSLRLQFRDSLPLTLRLEVRPVSGDQFTPLQVYAADGSCDQFVSQGITCYNISSVVEESGGDVTALLLTLSFPSPVAAIRVIGEGYQPGLSLNHQHYSLAEATVFATIAPGYFVRSLGYITIQGEDGVLTETGDQVSIAANEVQFPGFSSRGYAVLTFGGDEQVTVQYMFPSLPRATRYQIVFRYAKLGPSRRPIVMVMQGSRTYTVRVTLSTNCVPPCHAPLVNSENVTQVAEFDFEQGPVVVQMALSSIDLLLDSIVAIPQEFYAQESIIECDMMTGMLSTEACVRVAQQLSIDFFGATYPCSCQTPGAVGEVCQPYGGQCPCLEPAAGLESFTGRQCDLCPFYMYATPQGCTACECPDSLDMCALATGQCSSCPQLVVGRSCDMCVDNSFGDPSVGCEPCICDLIGSVSCDQTTGECTCKTGVTGVSCDRCSDDSFNFSSEGCEACGCDGVGSVGVGCNETGQCTCKPGVGGLKCSECLPDYFSFSDNGCSPCSCSGRTANCTSGPPSNSSAPQELCVCPHPYVGASCESCMEGFFLSDVTGDCEVCECNGRATACTAGIGECVDCMDNTTGSSCELCSDGFYDNNPSLDLDCSECPCDSITTFNSSCVLDASGDPVCYCLAGHVGSLCDVCDDGYFGSPPSFRCTSCDCNGNIDPDTPMSCDRNTGVCLVCINNSTGDECQFCDVGYFGDATIQDCQSCDCLEEGSDSSLCNSTTGQCSCLEGVGGQSCDQCLPGYWNFTDRVGCEVCACGEGSVSVVCDEVTGVCPCSPGVGGDECSNCLDGFFSFSPQGCTECGCGIGSVNASCSPEGRCYCQPGVTGDKCDLCEPFHTDLSSTGCQPCGECEQMVRTQLQGATGDLTQTKERLDLFEGLNQADVNGSRTINESLVQLSGGITSTEERLENVERSLDRLDIESSLVQGRVDMTFTEIDAALARVETLLPEAEDVFEHIQTVYNNMQNVLIDIGIVNAIIQPLKMSLDQKALTAEEIQFNISMTAMLHNGNFSEELIRARASLMEGNLVSNQAMFFLRNARMQQMQARNVTQKFDDIESRANDLSSTIDNLESDRDEVLDTIIAASTSRVQLTRDVTTVNDIIDFANDTLVDADSAINELQIALMGIQNLIEELSTLLGEEDNGGSGSGSGSGSGIEPFEPTTLSPEAPPISVIRGVSLLREGVVSLGLEVDECEQVLREAESHVITLQRQAEEINDTLSPSLSAGNTAASAIMDYIDTISMIQQALNITSGITETIRLVRDTIEILNAENFEDQTEDLLQDAVMLLSDAEEVRERVANLSQAVQNAIVLVQVDTNVTEQIAYKEMVLRNRVNGLRVTAEMFASTVTVSLAAIEERLDQSQENQEYISRTVPDLLSNVSSSLTLVNESQSLYNRAGDLLASTNASLSETSESVGESSELLSSIDTNAGNNEELLETIETNVASITDQLAIARSAAASIDVALRFFGNTRHTYRSPSQETSNSTSISLVFRPTQVDYGTLFYTTPGMESSGMGESNMGMGSDERGVSLRLYNGSVQFEYSREGVVSTDGGILQEEEWYQVFATRDLNSVYLSVSALQGGIPSYTSTATLSELATPTISGNDVIILGGDGNQDDSGPVVPNSDGFVGCIDRVIVNNAQLSLLLPNDMNTEVATCEPRPAAEFPRMFESGAWLQGAGSFLLFNSGPVDIELGVEFSLSFRTHTEDGIILYVTSVDLVSYVSVFLYGGRVVVEYSQTGLDSSRIQTDSAYNTGLWYGISVVIDQQGVTLDVNNTVLTGASPTVMTGAFNSSKYVFIGGVSPQVEAIVNTSRPSLPASVRDVAIDGDILDMQQSMDSYRVLPGNCPTQVSAGVRFMGEGYAGFEVTASEVEDLVSVSIDFRTTQLAALLLQLDSEPPISVSLYHTRVRVDIGSSSFVSQASGLNDNRWHAITLTVGSSNVSLSVDGETDSALVLYVNTTTDADTVAVVVGGTTNPQNAVVAESFRGCVRNVNVNGRMLDFNTALVLEGVALYGCRPPSLRIPLPPPPPPLPPPPSTRPNVTVGLEGNDGTFIAVRLDPLDVLDTYSIVLEFQTSSSDALLLYTEDVARLFADYMALELRGGRLYYSYNLGTGRVFIVSNETYNDGEIHTVDIRRAAQFGEMIIDGGLEYQSGSSPGTFSALNINSGLLFVGGIPSILNITLTWPGQQEPLSALACFHSLSINSIYEDLSNPHASSGAVPCLDAYNNIATFNADSYLQILDNFDAGTIFSFSLRFRTSDCSGLLIYVHSLLFPDHVVVELLNGTVRFVFDNGPMETTVEYTPSNSAELCDSQWHSLLVEKDGVRGTITVDGINTVTASSPFSNFRAVNTNDPLYIGGVPGSVRKRFTSMADTFQGCVGDVYLSQRDEDRRGLLLAQAVDGDNVDYHACSLYSI